MLPLSRFKKLVLGAASILIHFAHGGLLTVGFIVSLVIALQLAGGFDVAPLRAWAAQAIAEPDELPAEASDAAQARPGSAAVADYLSRRYRVARAAVEEMVRAAERVGAQVGLDPMLLVAVMAVESRFNPVAESSMGARGLMQVIPRFHMDKIDGNESMLLEPAANIQVGALVLKESIRRAGSLERGLQFYNGAPGDPEALYAGKVLAERARIQQAMRRTPPQRLAAAG